ncbi:MAG: F0F1 ATP synthase subunit epsilon, partial [Anaerolineae bacterium]|nr:F0F1 ATP synthase subunit epsilon [Anaerolineae bacterium]
MSTFHLEIVTVERNIYDDQVNMVIAPGSEGVLGILPNHTPLLTGLDYGELQIKKDGEEDQFLAIGGGFMEVQPHHVVVLADSAEHVDEIDIERAAAARQRAEERLARAKKGEDIDFSQAQAALRRSIVRIKITERRRRRSRGGAPG